MVLTKVSVNYYNEDLKLTSCNRTHYCSDGMVTIMACNCHSPARDWIIPGAASLPAIANRATATPKLSLVRAIMMLLLTGGAADVECPLAVGRHLTSTSWPRYRIWLRPSHHHQSYERKYPHPETGRFTCVTLWIQLRPHSPTWEYAFVSYFTNTVSSSDVEHSYFWKRLHVPHRGKAFWRPFNIGSYLTWESEKRR